MKRAIALMTFAIVFVLGIVPYARDDDDDTRQCSNATLRGSFGYTGTGSIVNGASVLPIAFVGRITFDGLGLAKFVQTISNNGVIFPAGSPVTTTYVVHADCTGSISAGNGYLVVDANGKEFRNILQVAGRVITIIGRNISTRD